jgi:hypothetical protein
MKRRAGFFMWATRSWGIARATLDTLPEARGARY